MSWSIFLLIIFCQNTPPQIGNVMHRSTNPSPTDTVIVRAQITDDGIIVADSLIYYGGTNTSCAVTNDSVVGDIYYYHIASLPANIINKYYIWAKDDSSATTIFAREYWVGELGLVINEVYYDSPERDTGCFIELKGTPGRSLDDWIIVGLNGANGREYNKIDLTGCTIAPDSYFVVAQDSSILRADLVTPKANLQNGPDNVQIRYCGVIVDAVGYGDFADAYFAGEWEATIDISAGHSIGRKPDCEDTDNNRKDFHECVVPTPGGPNIGIEEIVKMESNLEFTPSLTITSNELKICIPKGEEVQIYDILGRLIQTISDDTYSGKLEWNLKNWRDESVNSGFYFLKSNNTTKKVIVIR